VRNIARQRDQNRQRERQRERDRECERQRGKREWKRERNERARVLSFSLAGKGAIWMGARARVPSDYRVKDA
jgi:hypothetical protein